MGDLSRTGMKSPRYQEWKISVAPLTGDTSKPLKMYLIVAAAGNCALWVQLGLINNLTLIDFFGCVPQSTSLEP